MLSVAKLVTAGKESLPFIVGLSLAVLLAWRMIYADFCIIDDYVQVLWITPGSILHPSNFWSSLLQTEVGHLGSGGRFRPTYFAYLELETWLFGDRPDIFHAIRILYFGLFLGACGKAAAKSIGLIPSLIIVALIAGFAFWNNLWTWSLGPAEQIAVLGVSLVILAYSTIVSRLVKDEPIPFWALPLAGVGTAIAAGSKENFAWLFAPLLFAAAVMLMRRRMSVLSAALTLPTMTIPILVVYALLSASRNVQDFYGADNSVVHRLSVLLTQPVLSGIAFGSLLFAVVIVIIAYRHAQKPRDAFNRGAAAFLAVVLFLALDILWEIFFYDGRVPSGIRYDFPIMLLPIAIGVSFAGFVRFAFEDLPLVKLAVTLLAIGVTAFEVFHSGHAYSLPQASAMARERTQAFRRDWQRMRTLVDVHPNWPIVLEPYLPWDGEPIDSFYKWEDFFSVKNPILVGDTIPAGNLHNSFERDYANTIKGWSLKGKPESRLRALPDPKALVALNGQCFAIGFYRPPVSPCTPLPFHPERYIPHD